jgi:hypothetical protein
MGPAAVSEDVGKKPDVGHGIFRTGAIGHKQKLRQMSPCQKAEQGCYKTKKNKPKHNRGIKGYTKSLLFHIHLRFVNMPIV